MSISKFMIGFGSLVLLTAVGSSVSYLVTGCAFGPGRGCGMVGLASIIGDFWLAGVAFYMWRRAKGRSEPT